MMSKNYAVVKDGVVINIVVWDGETEWSPEIGTAIETDGSVGIGWGYDGVDFIAPTPDPIPDDLIISQNTYTKTQLLANASHHISVLVDATDPEVMGDDINPDDVEALKAWRKYRVDLSRVTDLLNPVWPVAPDA